VIQSNIKIVLENGLELDYQNAGDLNIKLNRIVEDYSDPGKRFGDFSYSFKLPKTKNNRKAFEYPDVKGRTRIFNGKQFECKLYDHSNLILDGIIELSSFDQSSFKCNFYSKFTQFADSIKNKKLNELQSLDVVSWNYEKSIVDHINGTKYSTQVEHPLIFYRTFFMRGLSGDTENTPENNLSWHYNYIILPVGLIVYSNPLYFGQLPPAVYLTAIVKAILQDAGWSLGGSFFEREDIKKIIIPFVGNGSDYLAAITSGTTATLNINKTLPDVDQTSFLKSVVNAFNLYFDIDVSNKVLKFETYNTLFSSNVDAYDLTDKLDFSTVEITQPETETKITFDEDDNNDTALVYGRSMNYGRFLANEPNPIRVVDVSKTFYPATTNPDNRIKYEKGSYAKLFNKTSGDKSIDLSFTPVNFNAYALYNDRSVTNLTPSSSKYPTKAFCVSIPHISSQTVKDNGGNVYASDSGTTWLEGNNTDNWTYDGGLKMMYYYGRYNYDWLLTGTTSNIKYRDLVWIAIATGGTVNNPTFARVRVPIASPFKLMSNQEKANLVSRAASFSIQQMGSEVGIEAQVLMMTWYNSSNTGNTHTPTNFSLTFSDNPDLSYPNLYSYFHQRKYENIRNGYVLTASMRCNAVDWKELRIDRPIKYNGEYFQLVSLKNYDVVKQSAEITLMKKT
jgi:hypothetical protein